jgi:hypothetical protein
MTKLSKSKTPTGLKLIPKKLQGLVGVEWQTLIEVSKAFSQRYSEDWGKLLVFYNEVGEDVAPRKSLKYLSKKLQGLEKKSILESDGTNEFFRVWRLGKNAFKDAKEVKVSLPPYIFAHYTKMSNRLGVSLDEVLKIGLRFYVTQRKYQGMQPIDIVKLAVLNNFGTSEFSRTALVYILKDSDVLGAIDMTLESYCGTSERTKSVFLTKVSEDRFKLI